MDIVIGGRIRRPQLDALLKACAGRNVVYTSHGPLAINFMDDSFRLQRHYDVLMASLDVSAEAGAIHYVLHSGLNPVQQSAGLESAYGRQRDWIAKAGDAAKERGLYLCVENLFGGYEGKVHSSSPSRLARELRAINHSHVVATLDFGHAYLQQNFSGGDFLAEAKALAPYAKHLHLHDNFGGQDDIWMFTDGERVAYGHSDLHLPVGWGAIPWEALMTECRFPAGCVFNVELKERYWYAAAECVAATKALAEIAGADLEKAA